MKHSPKDMVFADTGAGPVDAPAWPTQPDFWLQPELRPVPPTWSGIGIERCHRVPVPDFVRSAVAAATRSATPVFVEAAIPVVVRPKFPVSDLSPLGWNARAICRKEAGA